MYLNQADSAPVITRTHRRQWITFFAAILLNLGYQLAVLAFERYCLKVTGTKSEATVFKQKLRVDRVRVESAAQLQSAGYKARALRAQLASSYLACETITRQMQTIRAGLILPPRSALYLDAVAQEGDTAEPSAIPLVSAQGALADDA